MCHLLRDVSPLLILEWHFMAYVLVAHWGSSKGSGEFPSWGFSSCELGHKWRFTILLISWIWVAQGSSQFLALIHILWARSQVVNLHLAYLMDLGGARGVVLIPNTIFVSYIFFNYFRFRVLRKLLKIMFIQKFIQELFFEVWVERSYNPILYSITIDVFGFHKIRNPKR